MLPTSNLLRTFDGVCVLEAACRPKHADFVPLDPLNPYLSGDWVDEFIRQPG